MCFEYEIEGEKGIKFFLLEIKLKGFKNCGVVFFIYGVGLLGLVFWDFVVFGYFFMCYFVCWGFDSYVVDI